MKHYCIWYQLTWIRRYIPKKCAKRLNWQCCSGGSTKTAPRIFIFSIAMGADYLFELRNIEIWAPAFFKHSISSVATVFNFCFLLWTLFCWGPFTNFPFFYSEKKIRKFLIQEVLKLWARRMWLALEVIIDKSGGERLLWSRNRDFDWFLAGWQNNNKKMGQL